MTRYRPSFAEQVIDHIWYRVRGPEGRACGCVYGGGWNDWHAKMARAPERQKSRRTDWSGGSVWLLGLPSREPCRAVGEAPERLALSVYQTGTLSAGGTRTRALPSRRLIYR